MCSEREMPWLSLVSACTPVVLMSSIIILSWVKHIISLTVSCCCWGNRNTIKVELPISWLFSALLVIIILCNVLIKEENMRTGFPLSKVGWAILEKNSWLSYSHFEKQQYFGFVALSKPLVYCLVARPTWERSNIFFPPRTACPTFNCPF